MLPAKHPAQDRRARRRRAAPRRSHPRRARPVRRGRRRRWKRRSIGRPASFERRELRQLSGRQRRPQAETMRSRVHGAHGPLPAAQADEEYTGTGPDHLRTSHGDSNVELSAE